MRVLITEDNALLALDLEQQGTGAGHTVVGIADTSDKAIGLAKDYGADLTLMDVSLPDGLSGIDAAVLLKERFGIPSIFVTAALPDRPEVRQVGVSHLNRPYSEEEVVAAIQAAEAILRGEPPCSPLSRLRLFA